MGNRDRIIFIAANPSVDRLYEVESLHPGTIHRPTLVVARAGGKGLNAARAANTLGGSVVAITIAAGRSGDWVLDQLRVIGIDTRAIPSSGETRTCISVLDRSTGSLTEVYERGSPIEEDTWEQLELAVVQELSAGGIGGMAVSGSLPVGARSDGYARLAKLSAAAEVPIFVDTYGPALEELLDERPAVLKINGAEAAQATGYEVVDPDTAVSAARTLQQRGARRVIVTLGKAGAVILDGSEARHLSARGLDGRYPVGSGDAYLGSFAVAAVSGQSFLDAARQGMAAALANAHVPGAGEFEARAADNALQQVTDQLV